MRAEAPLAKHRWMSYESYAIYLRIDSRLEMAPVRALRVQSVPGKSARETLNVRGYCTRRG